MSYTPIHAAGDYDAYLREVEKQKKYLTGGAAGTDDLYTRYADVVNRALAGNGGERTAQKGTSGADEALLADGAYAIVQQLKGEYGNAQNRYNSAVAAGDTAGAAAARRDMDTAHADAERLRAAAGYTGGTDGSLYLPVAEYDAAGGGGLSSLAREWKSAAAAQSERQIDSAVEQGVAELERALEDARPLFKEQAESVALDEAQGVDNAALYAELRGDRGGIGQSQHNEIRAAAAQNRLAVQQAQTALGTETARQIADLRAQGEFEKADAALELAQQYLAQLMELEQWAAELGLDKAKFEADLDQWQAEYDMKLEQLLTENDLAYGELTGTVPSTGQQTLGSKKQLAQLGEAMLSAGLMPSSAQLSAMGITEAQARAWLTAQEEPEEEDGGSKIALPQLMSKEVSVR